jgi:esterase/lipase superfamily enzyme
LRQTSAAIFRSPSRGLRLLLALFALSALAACGRPGVSPMYPRIEAQVPGATEKLVLAATTRQRSADPGAMFNGERARQMDFAEAVISIPPNHVSGMVEYPAQPPGNPATEFVTRKADYIDSEKQFIAQLNAQLEQRPKGKREVLLFIHGYNTFFPEGLYRLAQVSHDGGSNAVPVYFSWASRGDLTGYVYDQNSATAARDALERLMIILAESKADKINVLAHSMGNWVTVEAFRDIRIGGTMKGNAHKMGAIILAAPDIDIDVFRSQMERIGAPKHPFLIVLSREDRALAVSRLIAGNQSRLGDYRNAADLTKFNAVVVDLSDVRSENPLNHDTFAELAGVAPQLRQVLEHGVGSHASAAETAAEAVTAPVQGAPGIVQTVLTLPIDMIAAPIVIFARATQ